MSDPFGRNRNQRPVFGKRRSWGMRGAVWGLVVLAAASPLVAAEGGRAAMVEWRAWGANNDQTRYSVASEITPQNVSELQIAWEWKHGEAPSSEFGGIRPGSFQGTPIMVDNVLYLITPYNRVVALDAESGAQLWAFDPDARALGQPLSGTGFHHRGPAMWADGAEKRIFLNSRDRLFALDAKTGKPIPSFGQGGSVSLIENLGRPIARTHVTQTSPPVVYKNLVILGSGVPDQIMFKGDPPGAVQAFDAKTGKRAWVWFTVPRSATDPGAETWLNESWKGASNGHANVWGPMALDERRGLLFVPTSTPGNDYYGGGRPGANLHAESLVTLDAATGRPKWHFQAVHHGIWDYDLGAPPNLLTINVDGRRIDAVAQTSKQGFIYVFDRVTGKPVWPIVERPVPTDTDVPGEQLYPTQPFPTKPPPFAPQGMSLDDANDLTPEIKALATEELSRVRLGPLFTPYMIGGAFQRPHPAGATGWAGSAVNPDTGMLYVKASTLGEIKRVCKAVNSDKLPWVKAEDINYQGYTYFVPCADPSPVAASKLQGIPLTKPPYGSLVAYDMNKGEIAWNAPFGDSPALRNHPMLQGVSLPDRLGNPASSPGPMVTKTGLVFIGGGEPFLYAFDGKTGREIWRGATPYRTSGNPMTYVSRAGRQFVLVATGAGSEASLVAFALGKAPTPTATPAAAPTGARGQDATASGGAALFAENCAACHGGDARGGRAPPLVPMTKEAFEVVSIVREGRGMMPPFGATEVSDTQIRAIIDYLKALPAPVT